MGVSTKYAITNASQSVGKAQQLCWILACCRQHFSKTHVHKKIVVSGILDPYHGCGVDNNTLLRREGSPLQCYRHSQIKEFKNLQYAVLLWV